MTQVRLYNGCCLEIMPTLEAGSVDCIIADLPYGVTNCAWDSVIPFAPLWAAYRHVLKPNGAIVLFACQPFTSALVMSNPRNFRYEWIWNKVNLFTNQMNASRMPMRQHENVCVFYAEQPTYNAQMRRGKRYTSRGGGRVEVYDVARRNVVDKGSSMAFPATVLDIPAMTAEPKGLHPTQKPVSLLTYLMQTYTNEGDTVLDNTMGSGTTGVACVKTLRNFIGIEKDAGYFQIAERRIADAQAQGNLFAEPAQSPAEPPPDATGDRVEARGLYFTPPHILETMRESDDAK